MLVLDSIRAAGAGRSLSRATVLLFSVPLDPGLKNPPSGNLSGVGDFSPCGGGAAGNRNSGIGFGEVLGDRCGPPALRGAPTMRPNRSGG